MLDKNFTEIYVESRARIISIINGNGKKLAISNDNSCYSKESITHGTLQCSKLEVQTNEMKFELVSL